VARVVRIESTLSDAQGIEVQERLMDFRKAQLING